MVDADENAMNPKVPFSQFAQSAPLFTVAEARKLYRKNKRSRTLLNLLHRLKRQGRVRQLANGVYTGAFATVPLDPYRVPQTLRSDAVVALHSALELLGLANQVFHTVHYFSAKTRKDVVFNNLTYHRVGPPRALSPGNRLFHTEHASDGVLVTGRERSLIDCLQFLEYSGGVEELDKSLSMFPSFDFDLALTYLKLLRRPWLYSRLGFLLDRHADKLFFRNKVRDQFLRKLPRGVAYLANKRPGNRWVPTWKLMVPETLFPGTQSLHT
jgi:predicted transcriptional regulator of viral defense system